MAGKNTQQVKLSNNPLRITTMDGFPDGMNLNDPAHEILDTEARYLQDVFVHQEGLTSRRGPLMDVSGMVSWGTDKLVGLVQTRDPAGAIQIGGLHMDTSNNLKFSVLSSNYSSKTLIATLATSINLTPYPIVDAKPAKNGGTYIGVSQQDNVAPTWEVLALWRGGASANYTTGTLTTTSGSATVAGSGTTWTSNITPGMFLMDGSSQLIGTVKSVGSNTSITLEEPPLVIVAGGSYTAQALRGFAPRAVQGTITTTTASTSVTGAGTKFLDEGVAANWRIFRLSDGTLVGTVNSVGSNKAITLGANATVALSGEEYYAVSNAADYNYTITDSTKKKPGFLNAAYADRQWFANRGISSDAGGEWINRLYFSEVTDPEDMDMSTVTGNYIPVVSGTGNNTPIKSIIPAFNAMVILKQDESFILVGQDENQFQLKKLGDDGTLSGMSAVSYNGGVVWAGRNGIYMYDGVSQQNITQGTLGQYYATAIRTFDPSTYRMWGAIVRDHYFLHIESVTPPVTVIKGTSSTAPTRVTIVIYLPRNAVTMFTNFNIRGGLSFTNSSGQQNWIALNTSTAGHVADVNTVIDSAGNDQITCDGGTAGPDMYIESKKYSAGNGLTLKSWKELLMHYLAGGAALKLDTVVGLNEIGATSTTTWPVSQYTWDTLALNYSTWDNLALTFPTWDTVNVTLYVARRIKFLKRNQYIAFRIYQSSSSVTSAAIGPFALAFKLMRIGRV
jgi:hypothetical protein